MENAFVCCEVCGGEGKLIKEDKKCVYCSGKGCVDWRIELVVILREIRDKLGGIWESMPGA